MAAQTVTKVTYVDNETVIGAANLNAIQDAVNNHAGLIDDLGNDKVDKVAGKGLSTNDFNNDAQSKLNNLPTGAQLDTSLGQKVGKRTSGTEVYTHTGSTQGGAALTETPTAGAVPIYGTDGTLKVGAPGAGGDAVRKIDLDNAKGELTEDVSDLKSATNQKFENIGYTEEASANLLNPDETETGRITSSKSDVQHTGTYDTDYRTTGFIPVTPGEKYGFYTLHNGVLSNVGVSNIWSYTTEKVALSYLGSITYSAAGLSYITAPENAAYIRASLTTSNYTLDGTVMCAVADGVTKPTEIVPYGTKYYLSGYAQLTDLKKWTGKKWVVFGDSLTEENSRTTKHYFDYVTDATGISTYNMGNSGSGYMNEQDLGTAFYQRISSVPTDADVITIFGSFNDNHYYSVLGEADDTGTETIGGCINTTLDNLFDAFPLANIGIVTPTPWTSQNPTTEPNNASAYVDLIKEICNKRSIPCLDLFHCSQLRPWDSEFRELAYSKDDGGGTHPDETGHKIIAPRFQAFLDQLLLH